MRNLGERNNKRIAIKLTLYILWFALVTLAVCVLYPGLFGTNTQGARCDYYDGNTKIFYQWVFYGKPCIYDSSFVFMAYCIYMVLYPAYDYIRRKIIGKNPGIFLRAGEVGLWFLLHWGSVIYLTISEYRAFNPIMIWTSFLGSVLFILPLFIIALLTKFLADKTVAKLLLGIVIFYILLILVAISYGK